MITPEQELFLSKYLHYVPETKMFGIGSRKHDKEEKFNAQLRKDFDRFNQRKDTVDGLISGIKSRMQGLQTQLTYMPSDMDTPELAGFRKTFDRLDNGYRKLESEAGHVSGTAKSAPEDAPVFGSSEVELAKIEVQLRWIEDNIPIMPAVVTDGALPALFKSKTAVNRKLTFADSKTLNDKVVELKLVDPAVELIRKTALKQYQDLCVTAEEDIDGMIKEVLAKTASAAPVMIDKARNRVEVLEAALVVPLKTLTDAINGQAKAKLGDLANLSDAARIEGDRLKYVTDQQAHIDKLLLAMKANTEKLKDEFAKAAGYTEKTAIQTKIKDEKKRIEDLNAQKVQLAAYEDTTVLRIGRIEAGINAGLAGAALAKDPRKVIGNLKTPPPDKTEDDKAYMLGGEDSEGNPVDGQYDALKKRYGRALKRVTVDTKLYPGEEDLTDITKDQHKVLIDMLDTGRGLALAKDYTQASYVIEQSVELFRTFVSANKFSLPAVVPAVPAADAALDIAIKAGGAELDDFWGYGGDADGALRATLAQIVLDRDAKVDNNETSEQDLAPLMARIKTFRKDVADQYDTFSQPQPSQKGVNAKAKAEGASNLVTKGLTELFKTRPLQPSEIGTIPANKLLTVKNGKTIEYYEILTKRGGTQDRREDKDVPFETLNMLYERAAMLDLLATETPMDDDSAAAMDKIATETAELLDAIKKGGDDYDHVFDQIKECKKAEAESIFKEWIPDGYYEMKQDFKAFQTDYPTKLLPKAARDEVDRILKAFKAMKTKAEVLKDTHAEVKKLIKAVEKQLVPGSADKTSPAKQLEVILKGGVKGLLKGFISSPQELKRADELILEIRAHMKDLTDLGIKKGLEGSFATDIRTAWDLLETKSETGMRNAKTKAEAVQKAMADTSNDLKRPDPISMAYLEKVAGFLTEEATAAQKAAADRKAAEEARTATDEKLKAALKILDDKKESLGSYKEYKTVYDSQHKGFEAAEKSYKADELSPSAAKDRFKQQLASATQLLSDLSNLINLGNTPPKMVNFAKWQDILTNDIKKVCQAATRAAGTLREKAKDDPQDVITAVDAAAKVLERAGTQDVEDIVKFKVDLGQIAADALNLTGDARKKAMALARETALSEVRRIRAETDRHPALIVYRDNPMDKGHTWPQFMVSLHGFDVEIVTKLDPA